MPVEIYSVNQSLLDALRSSTNVSEKRLWIDIAALKEYISTNEINEIKWIKLSNQLADKSTKQSANPPYLINALSDGLFDPEKSSSDLSLVYAFDSPKSSCV